MIALSRLLLAALVAFALAGSAGAAEPAATTVPALDVSDFELVGSRIIGCCCAHPCPCRLNMKPMNSHGCDHTDAVHIDKGHIGGVDMSGVSYVVAGRGFGSDATGNWAYVYVDDDATDATDAQYAAIGAMMTATVQGWGLKAAHLAGTFVGMREVPMSYAVSADQNSYSCTIPDILDFRTAAHYNPGRTEPVMSTGIMDSFGDKFVHADCLAHKYNDATINYSWDLTGRQSNFTEFALTDESAAQGGGWGCWTAHADFDAKSRYQEEMITQEHK